MADLHSQSAGGDADFDLTQFYGVFFEEAGENLDQMVDDQRRQTLSGFVQKQHLRIAKQRSGNRKHLLLAT